MVECVSPASGKHNVVITVTLTRKTSRGPIIMGSIWQGSEIVFFLSWLGL